MIGWAGPRGVGTARVYAHHALVLADLGAGDFESAYRNAAAVSPAGTLASHVPHALWIAMDLVEAAVHTGRRIEAERHVHALREAQSQQALTQTGDPHGGSAAMVAGEEEASALFEEALNLPTAEQWPFDVARVRLVYGEQLRRARALTEAKAS